MYGAAKEALHAQMSRSSTGGKERSCPEVPETVTEGENEPSDWPVGAGEPT